MTDEATWRRRRACDLAFESIAEALVRDQRPSDQDYGLMAVPLMDAFRAGDRGQLTCICELVERLLDLAPEDLPWSDDFRGRLVGLLISAELGAAVLVVERFGEWGSPNGPA